MSTRRVYVYEDPSGWTTVEAVDETGATVRRLVVPTPLLQERDVLEAQRFLTALPRALCPLRLV